MAEVGEVLEIEIGDVAHGGVFVARHEGQTIFVPDVAPGERAEIRITESKRRFARAEALRILEPSPERREHIWLEASIERDPADRVGGAELGHLALPFQRELKRRVLVDAMARFGGLAAGPAAEAEVEPAPGDDEADGLRWRTRATLHVDRHGNVGPYAARSRRIIPVRTLPLVVPDLEELAPLEGVEEGEPGSIELTAPAELDARRRFVPADRRARRREPALLTEVVADRRFLVDEDGFWQVHRMAATTLFEAVRDAARTAALRPDAPNLDLYGGVGLLAAALGEAIGPDARVETVEAFDRATERAAENLREWAGATAVTARVDAYLDRRLREEGPGALEGATVVLDPPRAGAGREVVEALDALEPARLVYVACDPVALARDAGLLRERGWELEMLRAFDLFPHTHHVEALARFRRA
ncbi:23S rRNA (uracil(1939)-C(5))-methyltransferase RlmD [Pseudoclavibacter triregionum]|nr:23S rRNA (uracil(1939)-C(5))-methyltransferase RlmD [Pseudoclavibacter triregionum]